MPTRYRGVFLYTLFASSVTYLLVYLLAAKNGTGGGALLSIAVGLCAYLVIRRFYKRDQEFDVISARAYRLLVWLVPLSFMLVELYVFHFEGQKPDFQQYVTLEDYIWLGPFALFIMPFANFFIFLKNCMISLWIVVYFAGFYALVFISPLVIVSLVMLIKQLVMLKRQSKVDFSLSLATVFTLAPIVGYATFWYFY